MAALNATGPEPAAASRRRTPKDADDAEDGGGLGVWWVIGIGLAIGAGIGFLLSSRKKNQL